MHQIGIPLIFTSLLLFSACKTPFTVNEYPLTTVSPRVTCEQQQQQQGCEERSQYWSAYVYTDVENIARLWSSNKRSDYILITVRAVLPTHEGVLVRDFPLFSIKRGNAKAHSGIDVFYKYPVNFSARDQVAFEIEIQYLKDEAALGIARTVIEQVEAIAKPFYEQYPLATEIVSGGKKLIASLVETADTPSSYKFSLSERDLDGAAMKTFLLEEMLDAKDDPTARSSKRFDGVRPCPDKAGALCRCAAVPATGAASTTCGYTTHRVEDFVYLTFRIERDQDVFDPKILIGKGAFDCPRISTAAVDTARSQIEANKYMFTPQDIGYALDAYEQADAYVRARGLIQEGKYAELLDLLNTNILSEERLSGVQGRPSEQLEEHWKGIRKCLLDVWEQSPGQEVLYAWTVFKQRDCVGVSRNKCRLDAIGSMLNRMARLNGLTFEASRPIGDRQGVIHDLLAREAVAIHGVQKQETRDWVTFEANCKDEKITGLFNTSISPYCTECVEIVAEKCAKINVRSIVSEKRNEVDAATLMNTEKKANEVRKDWKGGGEPTHVEIQPEAAGD